MRCDRMQTVTFTATDSCGNTSTCQAVIEILDTVDPTITCPSDTLTLECDSDGDFTILGNSLIAAWLGSATATDACSGAGVTNNYNPLGYSNGCGATGNQTVTFTATDSCGNTSTCQAVIEILDTIDPTITCPADTLTLECDADGDFTILGNSLIAAWLGSATATDACSGAGVTNNYNPLGYSNGCGATGMQTVTFTATDSCGNTSTCQAVIEILDTVDPTITCPSDTLTLECDSDGDFTILGNSLIAAWLGSATATDACSGAGVTNDYNPDGYSNGCGATGMQTVTFTATDSCGNTSTCQAVIEILDTVDPTITCPADTLTLECDSDGDFTILGNSLIAAWLGSATATDACSGAGVTNDYNPDGFSNGCGATGYRQ
ncbi:MAG: hypothetical protein IPN60_02765 [Saprospiraceae bacterium]|nr:hypothetical protein [Candidatus Opimibacter skivensis]